MTQVFINNFRTQGPYEITEVQVWTEVSVLKFTRLIMDTLEYIQRLGDILTSLFSRIEYPNDISDFLYCVHSTSRDKDRVVNYLFHPFTGFIVLPCMNIHLSTRKKIIRKDLSMTHVW